MPISVISVLAIYLLMLAIPTNARVLLQSERCREPDTNELLRILKSPDSETLPPSFLILPQLRNLKNNTRNPDQEENIRFSGEQDCGRASRELVNTGGNICPSYHVIHYDPDRVPSTVIQAECSCDHCYRKITSENGEFKCEKIFSYSRVLRKAGCKQDHETLQSVMQYTKEWEAVSMGCQCVYKAKYY